MGMCRQSQAMLVWYDFSRREAESGACVGPVTEQHPLSSLCDPKHTGVDHCNQTSSSHSFTLHTGGIIIECIASHTQSNQTPYTLTLGYDVFVDATAMWFTVPWVSCANRSHQVSVHDEMESDAGVWQSEAGLQVLSVRESVMRLSTG